jgi:hypothetical protein
VDGLKSRSVANAIERRLGYRGRGRPLGRPRHSWNDNIKIDLNGVGCGGMD